MAEKENENSFEESTFDRRFKEIVGIACPPEKEEQWCVVLQYAGYSMTEIHSILSTLGYPGYKEAGELPDAWVSKYNNATKYQQLTFDQSPCDEIPQFSPDLLRRLESAFAEKGPLSWSGEPRDADATSQREDQAAPTVDKPKRTATVNNRMKAELAANLETAKGWTAQQWADNLGCGKSTVIESETWKSLSLLRQQAKAERRNDRLRK